MTRTPKTTTRRPPAASLRNLTVIALISLLTVYASGTASLAQVAAVGLGTADSFAVLAGSTITNTGSSTVDGDVGLHPGSAVTGFEPGADQVILDGTLFVAEGVAEQAKQDLSTAYTNFAGQTPVTQIPTELGGSTLSPGAYASEAGTFGLTGTLTMDAGGDPDAVFIFQMATTLTTASDSSVSLINGANLCNVYWQVGSSATLGSNSDFLGTIMASESITLVNGASVEGRVLALNGAVTMDTNVISNSACATPLVVDDTDDTDATDDTPTEEAPAGDDSTSGEEDTPVAEGSPSGGDTTSQIQRVPGGSVDTGGGDLEAPGSTLPMLLTAMLMVLLAGGTAGLLARRRIR